MKHTLGTRLSSFLGYWLVLCLGVLMAGQAHAQERSPRVGGHVGFALPILTIADETTVIGSDFVNVGITPGITVKLNERWSIDFEFIAFNQWKNGTTVTTFVVDPGVVYSFDHFSAGLRVATEVGAARNIGVVPIIVKAFPIHELVSYFIELDLPVFFRDDGSSMQPSLTVLFQSGFGF